MAVGDTTLGTGATLTHADQTGELLSLSLDDVAREAVEVHHMGTIGVRPKLYPPTYSGGKLTATMHFNANETYDTPMKGSTDGNGSVVIELADGSTWTWATKSAQTSYGFDVPMDEAMTKTVVFDLGVVVAVTETP